jgi:hypothetical protein
MIKFSPALTTADWMVAELDRKIVHRQYLDPKVRHQTINNQSAETHHQISNKHEAMRCI